jgi:N6-adenosine-specific RNA methylase IME4
MAPFWLIRHGNLATGQARWLPIKTQKREHSRKPDELYAIIEACSPSLEFFARGQCANWNQWGDEVVDYAPPWLTYANHSQHWERQRA